jgi:outer membrane biosynthesis protein TonB
MVAHFAMPASVPPAAYSVPPQYYARPKSSSSFGSWVLGLAVVAGLLVTAYRNDLLLRGARAAHVEAQYLRIEKAFLGGPSFGTLRSVAALKIRETLAGISGTSQGVVVSPPAVAPQPAVAAAVAQPLPAALPKPAEPKTPPGAVDLKSLPLESDTPPPATAAPAQPAPVAQATKAPVKAPVPVAAKPAPAKPTAPAAVAKKEPAEKPAPAASEPSDALKAAMASKGAKASSDAPPAKEAAAKSGGDLPRTKSGELDLKAAIGDAVRRHPPKKKKGAPGSEYDPLNGDL